jgi:NAD(P)-dependent dehydrogenase (short-subunit alcohol dehydrogenase family)
MLGRAERQRRHGGDQAHPLPHLRNVRDEAQLKQAFDQGTAEIGPVDIILANAGIAPIALPEHEPHQAWQDVIDVNRYARLMTWPFRL